VYFSVHPSGFDATWENTGENVVSGVGGNGSSKRDEIAAQMQAAWDRLDEAARIDLLAVANGLVRQQSAKPRRG